MTPHISAKKEEIAKIVIMPGDPLRAKYIAENYLEPGYKLVNEIRGMLAYTGKYQGKEVTIMGHGMGIPSIGIYSYELFHFYDVDTIIRIGSCGSLLPEMKLGEVVLVEKAISDSTYAFSLGLDFNSKILPSSSNLFKLAKDFLVENQIKHYAGIVYSSDAFYGVKNCEDIQSLIDKKEILAIEMEAFGLYANAIKLKKQALTILTVSDSIVNGDSMEPELRRTSFKNMITTALNMALKI